MPPPHAATAELQAWHSIACAARWPRPCSHPSSHARLLRDGRPFGSCSCSGPAFHTAEHARTETALQASRPLCTVLWNPTRSAQCEHTRSVAYRPREQQVWDEMARPHEAVVVAVTLPLGHSAAFGIHVVRCRLGRDPILGRHGEESGRGHMVPQTVASTTTPQAKAAPPVALILMHRCHTLLPANPPDKANICFPGNSRRTAPR